MPCGPSKPGPGRPARLRRRVLAASILLVAIAGAPAAAADRNQAFVPPALLQAATANPTESFNVIVQGVQGRRSADVATQVSAQRTATPGRAIGIRHRFLTISGVAAQLTGAQIVRLANRPWILAITVDAPLRANVDLSPAVVGPPSISGTPQSGQTLTATTGSWSGDTPLTYAYQWQRCVAPLPCSDIVGATASSYAVSDADVGATLVVVVTATNTAGAASATSVATAVVAAAPVAAAPVSFVPPAIAGSADAGETLSADPGLWTGIGLAYAYQWRRCSATGDVCTDLVGANAPTYVLGVADVGSSLRVVVTATNGGGSSSATSSATAAVVLLPPSNGAPPTISGPAEDGTTLAAAAGGWAAAGAHYSYRWQRCDSSASACADVAGANADTYVAAAGDIGSTLRVVVTATNDAGSSSAASAATAVVAAAPPRSSAAPTISGIAQQDATLTAAVGTWTGTGLLSYAYQWSLCDLTGLVCTPLAGATSSTYIVLSADVGSTLRVAVTAANGVGSATASSDATALVLPPAPVGSGAPEISGDAREGGTLTASTGVWASTASIVYGYQWQRCDAVGSCVDVAGATASDYTATGADAGSSLRVVVTATDLGGSSAAASAATQPVVPLPPVSVTPPVASGTAQERATLTATAGDWTGAGTIAFAYEWQRCDPTTTLCAAIPGATAASYTAVSADVGSTLVVAVTASNGGGGTTVMSTPTAVVGVAGPANTLLPALSGTAQDGTTLTATAGEWTGTGPITVAYQWQRCDATATFCADIAGAGDASYTPDDADVGSTLRVVVTATNAGGATTAVSPASASVLSPAPVNDELPLVVGDAVDGDVLSATAGSWTADGDIQYAYQWRRCNAAGVCSDIPGAVLSLYPVSSDDVGSTLEVVATATGAGGATTAASLPTAVVAAAPPVSLNAVTISGTAQSGASLTATGDWGGTTPLAYAYQWERCDAGGAGCVAIAGATAAAYAAVDADVGSTLRVVVTASNAAGSSTSTSTATADVLPQRPVSAGAPAISGTLQEGSTLSVDAGDWSGGAPVTFSYQWQRCDPTGAQCADIAGATTSTYAAAVADIGATLRVVLGATNAAGTSSVTSAATARVAPQTASGFWSWQQWPYAVGVDKLWDAVSAAGATAPAIAVVDSGVDGSVSGLQGAVSDQVTLTALPQADAADGYGHGTFVAGIAAGRGDGYAGAAPTAHIVSLDVLDDNGMARTSDVIAAADWIYQHEDEDGIRVANFSLIGSAPTSMAFDPLDSAIEKLWFSGVVVVAAAGNFATDGQESEEPYAPANDPFAITVGATDINGTLPPDDDFTAPWSAWGHTLDGFAKPELGAPGRYMVAPVPIESTLYQTRPDRIVDPGTLQLSGTSFAAPIVSGVAADLLALHPSWTPDQVKGALMLSAAVPGVAEPFSSGVGEVDAAAALDVTDPPNPNAALDAFLVWDPAHGPTPVFDAASWETTVEADGSWGTDSWDAGSWGTGSWGTGSWGTNYWSANSYGPSISWDTGSWGTGSWGTGSWGTGSWGTGSWGTADPSDNATGDASPTGGYWLNPSP